MVKKLGLISLFSSSKDSAASTSGAAAPSSSSSMSAASSWQWPSCKQPRTLSFRDTAASKQAYMKTMNSAYLPDSGADSYSFSTSFASVNSLSTASEEVDANEAEADAVIRALRSDRLFFEPDASLAMAASSSVFKKAEEVKAVDDGKNTTAAFEGATAMSMESANPYRDFRASMEEMVMNHQGVKDWRWLEEMLGWYLRANGKSTHGLIVGAFVDLLVALSDTTTASPSSPTTCSSSCACSCSGATDEIKEEGGAVH